jgi:hypothetical protein
MKHTLKESNAAEIICRNYYRKLFTIDETAKYIADMLRSDWGLEEGMTMRKAIDPETLVSEVVDYICLSILGQPDAHSVSWEVFNAFLDLEVEYVREDEDYEDEAADDRCNMMMLSRHGY